MLRRVCVLSSLLFAFTLSLAAQDSRHFKFRYALTIKQVPAGEKIRIWMPAAHSDRFQEVRVAFIRGDLPLKSTTESKYGNRLYYAESALPKAELQFEIEYDVIRHERIALRPSRSHLSGVSISSSEKQQDLQPDALVPVSGVPADLALRVTRGKTDPLDKARAIYEYVFSTLSYDKTGTGWGRGDVLYACTAKKGNCTDFHSLFIAMARSQGIPARFEIGFPVPSDKHSAAIAGYHCWSEFYIDGKGWIPVDISEAWKHPERRDYFFGSHDVNRVQFSVGRDLTLNPSQKGKPLNYFIYPYVEVGGKEYSNVSTAFSFADESPSIASQ